MKANNIMMVENRTYILVDMNMSFLLQTLIYMIHNENLIKSSYTTHYSATESNAQKVGFFALYSIMKMKNSFLAA